MKQDDVFGETLFERFLNHGRTAILDHDDTVTETFDVGKGLDQQVLLNSRGYHVRFRW